MFRKFALAFVLLLFCTSVTNAQQTGSGSKKIGAHKVDAPRTFSELLEGFRSMTGLEASFVEEKKLALLEKPLVNRGTLYFLPPQTLLRTVNTPSESRVLITPKRIVSWQNGKHEVIDLKSRQQLRPFVESLLWLFSGDQGAIEEFYHIQFSPANAGSKGWRLSLKPKTKEISQLIQKLEISGTGYFVDQIEVHDRNGDHSISKISDANPRRKFSEKERRRWFTEPTP